MSLRVSMRSTLPAEVPSLHDSLETLTLTNRLHIDPLPKSKMRGAKSKAHRQEVLRGYLELSQVLLGWQTILQEMTSLRLLEFLEVDVSATNLHGREMWQLLNLGHLASIDLDD